MRNNAHLYRQLPSGGIKCILVKIRAARTFLDSKLKKVTVLIDEQEFRRFESYCQERGFKKSTLAARLIREHLDREAFNTQQQLPLLSSSRQE